MRPLVIIADHNPFVRKSVKEIFIDLDIEVREALSGSDALQIARNFPPDVIILESDLPGPGNRSALKAIKGEDGLRHVPVILLKEKNLVKKRSGSIIIEDETAFQGESQEKAFDIIEQPFSRERLIETVKKAIASVRGQNVIPEKELPNKTASGRSAEKSQIKPYGIEESLPPKSKIKFMEFEDNDFYRYQDFLMKKVGLFFDIKRKSDLGKALRNRIVALEMDSYLDYYQYLSHSLHEEKELRNLVLYLTIGETTFFRSPDQFKALREYILPRLLPERRKSSHPPSLKIWSAGCSTGEEPYSLAITLREIIPDIDNWNIKLYASDINQKFLHFAEEGLYHPRKVRFVNESILNRYFIKEGEFYRVIPELRKMVEFGFHNLTLDSGHKLEETDIVLCRNVLIYFRRDRIKNIIDKYFKVLKKDGYLILGYSETLFQISNDFKSIHYGDAFFYVKTEKSEKNALQALFERPAQNEKSSVAETVGEEHPPLNTFSPRDPTEKYLKTIPAPAALPDIPTEAKSFVSGFRAKQKIEEISPDKIKLEPEDQEIDVLWEEGLNHYFFERFDMAEKLFKKLAEKHPGSALSKLGIGFIYANKGQDAVAMDKIEQSLEINNLNPEAYYLRALIKEKNGDVEAAMADYRNVILLDPDFAMAHFNLGILFMKQNRLKDSRREFRNTLRILKKFEPGWSIKFSGGLHRDALIQLCEELSE